MTRNVGVAQRFNRTIKLMIEKYLGLKKIFRDKSCTKLLHKKFEFLGVYYLVSIIRHNWEGGKGLSNGICFFWSKNRYQRKKVEIFARDLVGFFPRRKVVGKYREISAEIFRLFSVVPIFRYYLLKLYMIVLYFLNKYY